MDPDTAIGGPAARFPETRHTLMEAARGNDPAERRRAEKTLLAAYWKPVYKYLRLKWRLANEDAKDLTQGFFTRAVDREFFASYDPSRGGFRTYLRVCLDRFCSSEHERSRRGKRGGGATLLPLEFETAEGELRELEVDSGFNVEQFFHSEWVRSVFDIALSRFQARCASKGKEVHCRLFLRYDLEGGPELSYRALAEEFQLAATDVTNYLHWARKTFREVVRETVGELTGSEREFQEEMRVLLGRSAG
ncbi:MAG: RNA polymerase sigma factor [Bryobacteraceae bacterium]